MCGVVKIRIVRESFLSILFIFPVYSQAVEWQASIQHAGFMGEVSIAGGFENIAGWFGMDFGMGISHDQNGESVQQFNLKLRLQPITWDLGVYGKLLLPYVGLQAMITPDSRYFMESPDPLPEKNYYDFTKLRFGIPIGVAWRGQHWTLYAESVLLDTDALAQYNTNSALDYREVMSSALGLRYHF